MTPRQTAAVMTFMILIVLYCMPVLLLGWHLWDIEGAILEYDQPIPRMVITFNSGTGGQEGAAATPDLLSMLHRVLLPVATLISGLLAVSLSRSNLNYALIGLLLFLIVLVFATYVAAGSAMPVEQSPVGGEGENLQVLGSELSRIAISTVLSRTFDTLFSFVLLFLGIAVGTQETDGGRKPTTDDDSLPPASTADDLEKDANPGKEEPRHDLGHVQG